MKLVQRGGACQAQRVGIIWLFAMIFALAVAGLVKAQLPHVIDAGSIGAAFSPGVRGMALSDPLVNTPQHLTGLPLTLEVARKLSAQVLRRV